KPLPLADAQALLGEGDALVLFLDLPQFGRVPEETIVFALTKKGTRWASIGLGAGALRERVAALRCGLDTGAWRDAGRQECRDLAGAEPSFYSDGEAIAETLPFDLARANGLYRDLFGGIEDLVAGNRLLIVPSGALTQLPFEVLVTSFAEKNKYGERVKKAGRLGAALENIPSATGVKITQIIPSEAADKAGLKASDIVLSLNGQAFAETQRLIAAIQAQEPGAQVSLRVLRDGSEIALEATLGETEKREWIPRFIGENDGRNFVWLGQQQAITILPSAGSLKALRAAKASEAAEPFAGFGNPLLTGVDGTDKSAWAKRDCSKPAPPKQSRIASLAASIASLFRGGAVNVEDLRRQPPLPETADELCSVGRELGVPESRLEKAIYLGERATVSQVKALSRSGDLARARVVHFATHGLLAGETALFAKNKAEPALLLTPPPEASEEDNGLLTASEVAQLKLNADWVVMSACNTASGSTEGAEALSGLARAFFYAGARALLVSHWYVDSEAAVAITTGAVNAMKAHPEIGRAEALRRSEAALIAKGGRFAHPSVWAPFVVVGNGEQ
ncbi:MAG: CHAT domain-containing protein, partial [Rhodomicrobium sp.]